MKCILPVCVCAHPCACTYFTSLRKAYNHRSCFFFTDPVAAICILSLERGEGKREGKEYSLSLTSPRGEGKPHLFSPQQGSGGTVTVCAILPLQKVLPHSACGWKWAQEGQVCLILPSVSRLISHYSQLYNVITAQIYSSKL